MNGLLTITAHTLHEARRRKILLAALLFGVALVALFAIGFFFVHRDLTKQSAMSLVQRPVLLNFFTMAGLYAANFLMVMTAVLLPVDTLSGPIASGAMQTLATKPIGRWEILLGKWLAYALVLAGYLLLLAAGIVTVARIVSGQTPPNVTTGIPLMYLEGMLVLTLTIACGARLGGIASGVTVFGLYGLAFIANWIEQIGAMVGNATARSIGTAASLVMPSEAMWQLAAWHMQPPLARELQLTPFSPASVPSGAMVAWALGYLVVTLALGLWSFARREL